MKYYSLNNTVQQVGFKQAVIQGLAPDKGLYFPSSIAPLPASFFESIEDMDHQEIAFRAIEQFVGEDIPEPELRAIIAETLSFQFPVKEVERDTYSLELFHGPTMAFKDVGARFMSRCLGYFNRGRGGNTVLVATSGDTGGAVAAGFLGVEGVRVAILYPRGKVSEVQERQMTTLGENITAYEVDGTFDDCQDMVKRAFLDEGLRHLHLTSANSINIARWLPQMFYFFFAYKALKHLGKPLVFSCPSGNFGNSCAGALAKRLGLPMRHLVTATNVNDTVPRFMDKGVYEPRPTIATISNAMDVSNPSNFVRILALYGNDVEQLRRDFSSFSFTDQQTLEAMRQLHRRAGYTADPHGAVGYLGLKRYMEGDGGAGAVGVFLETAHPIKFIDTVEPALGISLDVPPQIRAVMDKEKRSVRIKTYDDLRRRLA